jgi:hypothetical protein
MTTTIPEAGDRRSGRDRREGFVDSILYGRILDELIRAETGADRAMSEELTADLDAYGRGLARALAILSGRDVDEIRSFARAESANRARVFDGMSSLGERTPRALEELVPGEVSDDCPACGAPMSSPARPGCVLVDEHEIELLDVEKILEERGPAV